MKTILKKTRKAVIIDIPSNIDNNLQFMFKYDYCLIVDINETNPNVTYFTMFDILKKERRSINDVEKMIDYCNEKGLYKQCVAIRKAINNYKLELQF